MTKHKWAKEIKAWADGAIIECRRHYDPYGLGWNITEPTWEKNFEYRIKPQPKEPQYLYVYWDVKKDEVWFGTKNDYELRNLKSIGKIKLEQDDE